MTRQAISDQFNGGTLQTQAGPIAGNHFQRGPTPESKWKGLANVFASGEMLAQQYAADKRQEDAERAHAWANSKTAEELSQEIKEGKLLSSESPVFVAAVQHIYGRNTYDAMERDVMGKVTRGELTFNNPGEVDALLTRTRNEALAGHSEYAAAGFDKGFSTLRPKLMDAAARVNDNKFVAEAAAQSSDALRNHLLKVTGPGYTGTPDEAAASVMQEYQFLRLAKALPDSVAKDTLKGTIATAAAGGQPDLVTALLKQELPNIGSVRGFLGDTDAVTLEGKAMAHFDQNQRQRLDEESGPWYSQASEGTLNEERFRAWANADQNKKYTSAAFVQSLIDRNASALAHKQKEMLQASMQAQVDASEAAARAKVDAALTDGTLYKAQGTNNPQVLTANGSVKDFNVKDYAEQSLKARTTNLPFDQQVSAWAMNGLEHPDWSNQIKAGLHNLASIGVDAKGKPTGELNAESVKALELFRQINAVNPSYAQQVAGETAAKRFGDIDFLTHLGRTPADAAAIAANANSGAIIGSDVGKTVAKIEKTANELVGNPWYKPDWWSHLWGDSTAHNTAQVTGMVRRYATLLAHSGQYGTADEAIEAAAKYIGDPKVSARVNGTLYLRSELPQAPGAESQEEWLGKFIDQVPKASAQKQGFSGQEVRMEYSPATKGFTAMVGNLPMLAEDGQSVVTYSKADIQRWYADTRQTEIAGRIADNKYAAYQARIQNEVGKLPAYEMERYDPHLHGAFFKARISSRSAFDQIVKDGNADKPLTDLMRLYPRNKAKQQGK